MIQNLIEEKVKINSTFELGATIARPENRSGKIPAVVLISGTGTSDRDGNMKRFNSNIYKHLSDFFVNLGFVTIRYDKRGVAESKGVHVETGLNDLVEDVIANMNYLENLDYVDRDKIILCGHSEGTMVATITSTKKKVAGLILIGGAGTTLKSALVYQNWMILQEIRNMKGFKRWLLSRLITEKNYLKNVNKLFDKCGKTDKNVIRVMGIKIAAKWIREHDALTEQGMVDILTNANYPIMAITGEKDVQANPEDINKLAELALPHVTCKIIPGMDHILRAYNGDLTILNIKKQYKNELNQPLHEGLLKTMNEWVTNNGFINS